MNSIITTEVREGKISICEVIPNCVHAIGGVPKKDGSLRPITDCSRPIGRSINNYMNSTAIAFHFKTLDYVADLLTPGCYLGVVPTGPFQFGPHIAPIKGLSGKVFFTQTTDCRPG